MLSLHDIKSQQCKMKPIKYHLLCYVWSVSWVLQVTAEALFLLYFLHCSGTTEMIFTILFELHYKISHMGETKRDTMTKSCYYWKDLGSGYIGILHVMQDLLVREDEAWGHSTMNMGQQSIIGKNCPDIMCILCQSDHCNSSFLTCMDLLSSWPKCFAIPDRWANSVVKVFLSKPSLLWIINVLPKR